MIAGTGRTVPGSRAGDLARVVGARARPGRYRAPVIGDASHPAETS